jgi:hypothetical protein
MKPKFFCTHCGRNEIEAIEQGCGEPAPRYHNGERITACPMEIRSPFRRFLFNRFGIKP